MGWLVKGLECCVLSSQVWTPKQNNGSRPAQGVNYAIQNGAHLSRAKVLFFKHNDMADLQRLLAAQEEADRQHRCVLAGACAVSGA
jgi:hypothetical protein